MLMFQRTLKVFAIASPLWASMAIEAQEKEFEEVLRDPETVSIATSRPQPIRLAPAVTTVITAEDIRDTGARDLIDILRQVPGFHIGWRTNQWDPVFAVRGFNSPFNQNVLLMLDGVPQTELVLGDRRVTLGKVPLDIIERVEVMRGPGSALYGADAFSAVVNIITKKNVPEQAQIVLSGGSHETYDVRAIGGRDIGDIKIVGALEYWTTDGHEPLIEVDQQTRLDALMGTRASLAPSRANTHREEFGAHVNLAGQHASLGLRASGWRDIGMGIGAASALDPFGSVDSTTLEATFRYRRGRADNWAFEGVADGLMLNYKINDWHFFPPGAFRVFPQGVIFNNEFDERFLRLKGVLQNGAFKNHYLTLGTGAELGQFELESESRNYRLQDGLVIPLGPVQDTTDTFSLRGGTWIKRNLVYVFFQDEWVLHPNWALTWGVRYDHYSDFGDTVNPRAALVWNAWHDLTAKFLYGRGFRSPSLLEARARDIPAVQGNPNLRPEKLNSYELAIDYRPWLDLRTRANFFYQVTDDQIRLQSPGGPEYTSDNVDKQKGHGLELELWWDITPQTNFYGFYAYQQNTDETTGRDAAYSPHHKVYARMQQRYRKWLFTTQAMYTGERDRRPEDPRPHAETYTFVDVLTRYDFSKHLGISLDIRNLLDEDAEEAGIGTAFPGDMPLPGRTYYLSIIGQF